MTPALLAAVVSLLDRAGIRCALIGAAALAARGVARSTFDLDLLTTDLRALEANIWRELIDTGAQVSVRRGDAEDPLAGVVRVERASDRTVDVVVGKSGWQDAIAARAEPIEIDRAVVPVARASDLILLKLYAGGSQDAWDIEQLLATDERDGLVAAVNAEIGLLPHHAQQRWQRILGDTKKGA